MNFFEHQDKAKRKTGILVVYFLIAIILIVIAVNLAVYLVFYFALGETAEKYANFRTWFTGPAAFWITLATLAVILIGTLIKSLKLMSGGKAVAEIVGARRIERDTRDISERRLINVVEEMSIASGTPVPELYILEDPAINAFVAGFRPTEVVMVVTRGALDTFSRDELQGVIGHEYSHIFNGDMRINIHLMGILAGILLIGQIGEFLLRSGSRNRKGGGQAMAIGVALFIVGYIGLFFGSLIKSAISRQREFLADASSVQFTRNPDGIAGALYAIKENSSGSMLQNAHAEDVSHFCFGDAVGMKFTEMLATHPPLDKRIKAINPRFDNQAAAQRLQKRREQAQNPAAAEDTTGQEKAEGLEAAFPGPAAVVAGAAVAASILNSEKVTASIGQVDARHLDYAERLHAAIPDQLRDATHSLANARHLMYALILADMKDEDRQAGIDCIRNEEGKAMIDTMNDLIKLLQEAGQQFRLPLINMSIPTLKLLNLETRGRFLVTLEELIKCDKRYTIFEFTLITILSEHLAENSGRNIKEKYFKIEQVLQEINLLLSVLIRIGSSSEDEANTIYSKIMKHFVAEPPGLADKSECKLKNINAALQTLNLLTPLLKKTLIESFADCVIHDGKVKPAEAELLQAIAISLDCPMPPLQV